MTDTDPDMMEIDGMRVPNTKLFMVFDDPKLRPPVIEEMMDDIRRVIASIAHKYTDQSCPHLQFDELMSQGYEKLAKVITSGWPERLPNRFEFFKFFKTVVNNHIKGQVHRYRFTTKRTGIVRSKADRHNPDAAYIPSKPIEISLNDPDANLQVSEGSEEHQVYRDELYEDICHILTPLEKLVLNSKLEANSATMAFAELDAHRGKKFGSVKINVKPIHQAAGLGMDLATFQLLEESIKTKVTQMQTTADSNAKIAYQAALAQLEQIFSIQIPRSIDEVVIKRLLTIAARSQSQKVTPDVAELLAIVGAKVPTPSADGQIACYGVLWQKGHQICNTCGLQTACRSEALNYGLTDITIHPTLLGAKITRIATIVEEETSATQTITNEPRKPKPITGPILSSARDEEILHHLNESLTRTIYKDEIYYKHREKLSTGRIRLIFWLGQGAGPLDMRICKPSEALIPQLIKCKNGYYLPDKMSAEAAIKLIDQHTKDTFE